MSESLALINSLKLVDYDADGEILYYAIVENTAENRLVLNNAGVTDKEIESSICHHDNSELIDLTGFIWNFAEWFDGEKFLKEKPF